MTKSRAKQVIWVLASLLLLSATLFASGQLGEFLLRAQRGADPAAALKEIPPVPAASLATLTWLPDAVDTGRAMEPKTRRQVEEAYLRAWLQWNNALARAESTGLATYFVGPALDAVTESITAKEAGWRLEQVDTRHTLQLHFYSADGSIVSLTDAPLIVEQTVWDANGDPVLTQQLASTYDVIMFLEDGNWRVRHWVRR
jgi:hypothetical protein